jgi:hypothetical protein
MRLSRFLNILQCKTAVRAVFEGEGLFRSLSTHRELRCASSSFLVAPFRSPDVARAAGAASVPAHAGFRPCAKRSLQRSIELRHRCDERDIPPLNHLGASAAVFAGLSRASRAAAARFFTFEGGTQAKTRQGISAADAAGARSTLTA